MCSSNLFLVLESLLGEWGLSGARPPIPPALDRGWLLEALSGQLCFAQGSGKDPGTVAAVCLVPDVTCVSRQDVCGSPFSSQ